MKEGEGPTLKGPQLQRELEKMNIELEGPASQTQHKPRNKNNGRTTLPNDKVQETIIMEQTSENNNPSRSNDTTAHPEDRVVARQDRILAMLERQETPAASGRRVVEIAAGVALGTVFTVAASEAVKWLLAPPALKK